MGNGLSLHRLHRLILIDPTFILLGDAICRGSVHWIHWNRGYSGDGLVLCFRELPGQDQLCRISEIGPPGRVTCLLELHKVLAALKQQEPGGDWYRAMRQIVESEGTAPMEYVSPGGSLLLSTLPS
jgi:hypothetical protein